MKQDGRIWIVLILIVLVLFLWSNKGKDNNQNHPIIPFNHTDSNVIFFDFHKGWELNDPTMFSDHELLDTVILQTGWAEIEPQKGVFNFDSLDSRIDTWSNTNKDICLRVVTYGQQETNNPTPEWVYGIVPTISFTASKESRGNIRIPKVWDDTYLQEYEIFIKKLGEHYNNDNRIKCIEIGVGHIGYTNAQPSKEGSDAFIQSGWSLDVWEQYVKKVIDLYSNNLNQKKLIIAVPPMLMKNYNLIDNIDVGKRIVSYATNKNYGILFVGVEVDNQMFEQTAIPELVKYLSSLNLENVAIGFGDDWSMYGKTGSKIRNEQDFQSILDNIYNLWVETGKKNPIFLKLLANELVASEQGNAQFNQNIYNSLTDFIQRVGGI